jgi:hypothetical protein
VKERYGFESHQHRHWINAAPQLTPVLYIISNRFTPAEGFTFISHSTEKVNMKKVYMVIFGDDWQSGYWVHGIFSTRQKAELAIRTNFSSDDIEWYGVQIREVELNTVWEPNNRRIDSGEEII